MKVHLLEKYIDDYLRKQLSEDNTDWYYPHALVNTFHAHWHTPLENDLKEMYDECLQSNYSQRWWKGDQYRPKEIMLQLIDTQPELAVIAWKDLANESGSLEGRLSRFAFYCEDLLRTHRQQSPRSVETHHHQDASIVSLYLAGMYPDKYVLYPGLEKFQSFCKSVGRPDIPVIDDLVRYEKVATIVFTFLKKNERFTDLMELRDVSVHKVTCIPNQIAYEIMNS